LVDAVQDIIIREEDCGDTGGHIITRADSERIGEKFESRIFGRVLSEDIKVNGTTIAKKGDEIDANVIETLNESKIESVALRSVMTCKTRGGICVKCYGRDLSDNKTVKIGTPVGISAETVTKMLVKVVDEALRKGELKMEHYSVAAKTGTAQIADPATKGYYEDRYLHSFFGYFPAYEPKFIVFLYQKYPKGAQYASETLAEPFNELTKFLIDYYNVPPDR
jgi:hypothetical protein